MLHVLTVAARIGLPSLPEDRMAMDYCISLGVVMTLLGLFGSTTGGHDHTFWLFGTNLFHNTLRLSLGFLALAAVAAGPRQTRKFCLAAGGALSGLAMLGFEGFAIVEEVFNPKPFDLWLYLAVGLTCLALGLLSRVPLRVRDAVEQAPITWA
jgi:hypothetical protein